MVSSVMRSKLRVRGKIRGDLGYKSVWGEVGDKLVIGGVYKSGGVREEVELN